MPIYLLCRPLGAETANGCLVLDREGTTAERHERELKHLRILCTRFFEARRESFCPLDTDLSWMSASRKLSKRVAGLPSDALPSVDDRQLGAIGGRFVNHTEHDHGAVGKGMGAAGVGEIQAAGGRIVGRKEHCYEA